MSTVIVFGYNYEVIVTTPFPMTQNYTHTLQHMYALTGIIPCGMEFMLRVDDIVMSPMHNIIEVLLDHHALYTAHMSTFTIYVFTACIWGQLNECILSIHT